MTNGLPQPLRFLPRFFTTLFDPLCGDVAVATAERVSPFPATAGKLSISGIQYGATWYKSLPGLQITALQSILNPCLVLLCFLQYSGVHVFLLRRISDRIKKEGKKDVLTII
jgi:hypothetical protein